MFIIKDLNLRLGQFCLKNVNLKIKKGEYFVLLGPSGAGKTVLLETIAGRYKPVSGEILFNGKNLIPLLPEERKIGFVYQQYELFSHMTARENIIFGLKIRKQSNDIIVKKLKNLVELLNIGHLLERYPKNLSGGEQQRVALARAFIISPDILLLDEPMSALDPVTKSKLLRELKEIHDLYNFTVIHVTHDINEALYLFDEKLGIMNDGEIVQTGDPIKMIKSPKDSLVSDFLNLELGKRRYENFEVL